MGLVPVTFYKGECDQPACKADPLEDSEYAAWSEPGQVIESAQERDWYIADGPDDTQVMLCDDHAPRCDCPGCEACKTYPEGNCKVQLLDAEFGKRCEDCFIEAEEAKA